MSAYREVQTEFKDAALLVQALEAVGTHQGNSLQGLVENNKSPVALFGYQGDEREQKANIVIRRKHVGIAANDVGFEKVGNKFIARISEYDTRCGYNQKWLGRVKQEYATLRTIAKARRQGYRVSREKTPEGKVKLVCRR